MAYAIAEMTSDDYAEAAALWRSTPGVGLNDADTPARLRDYLHRNPGLSFVAREDGEIIGAVLCGHEGRRGYLHHLAVAPSHRRQGIGRELVRRSLAALASAGIEKCNLFLYADNAEGARFWMNDGWIERDWKVFSKDTPRP